MPQRTHPNGFTLVELLVVVTIIALLLALLMPAMGKAVYQAQIAVCGTQVRNIAAGVTGYAMGNNRFYPDRGLDTGAEYGNEQPAIIRYGSHGNPLRPVDQRILLRSALGGLTAALNDPLTGQITIDDTRGDWIFSPYNLWWGFRYTTRGTHMMEKIDETWDYDGDEYTILASDRDLVRPASDYREVQTSHGDGQYTKGRCANKVLDGVPDPWLITGSTITMSFWWSAPGFGHERGPVDNNYAMNDLSVQRHRVAYDAWNRQEMRAVGTFSGAQAGVPGHLMYVP